MLGNIQPKMNAWIMKLIHAVKIEMLASMDTGMNAHMLHTHTDCGSCIPGTGIFPTGTWPSRDKAKNQALIILPYG